MESLNFIGNMNKVSRIANRIDLHCLSGAKLRIARGTFDANNIDLQSHLAQWTYYDARRFRSTVPAAACSCPIV